MFKRKQLQHPLGGLRSPVCTRHLRKHRCLLSSFLSFCSKAQEEAGRILLLEKDTPTLLGSLILNHWCVLPGRVSSLLPSPGQEEVALGSSLALG